MPPYKVPPEVTSKISKSLHRVARKDPLTTNVDKILITNVQKEKQEDLVYTSNDQQLLTHPADPDRHGRARKKETTKPEEAREVLTSLDTGNASAPQHYDTQMNSEQVLQGGTEAIIEENPGPWLAESLLQIPATQDDNSKSDAKEEDLTSHQNQLTKTLVEGYRSAANQESSNNQQDTTPHEASVQLLPKFNSPRNKAQDLNKIVYGLVDAPRTFYLKQMEELKHNDPHQPEIDFTLFTYKLKNQTLKDAVTIAQVEDPPTVGKQNITKLAQQEVEKKLRLGSIEDLPIRILSLNQNRYYNRGPVENSKPYVDDPEIPFPSYLHDEAEQYILNLVLQSYRRNPRRVALTDREKQSTEQPKTVHEVRAPIIQHNGRSYQISQGKYYVTAIDLSRTVSQDLAKIKED